MRMRSLVVLVALLLISVGGAAYADKDKAKASYRRGMAAFLLNQYDDAIREFEAGFREEPEAAFLYNIAQAHGKAGRRMRAIEFYRKHLELAGEAAPDRAQVELRIEELRKEEEAATALVVPPTPIEPTPVVVVAPPPPAPPAKEKKKTPAWVWAVVGVGAVIVVGGVIGGALAATTPVDAPQHMGTERATQVRF